MTTPEPTSTPAPLTNRVTVLTDRGHALVSISRLRKQLRRARSRRPGGGRPVPRRPDPRRGPQRHRLSVQKRPAVCASRRPPVPC